MVRTMTLVLLAAAAAGAIGGCGGSQAQTGCSLSASDITCKGETFDACAVAGCPVSDIDCPIPGTGCQIAPGMVLAHYSAKPPNDAYLCGYPLSTCGTWSEASCQVTVTNYLGGAPDAGVSITYAIHDSTCP
jgi:hypothetical protein